RNAGTYANVVTAPEQANYTVTAVDGALAIAKAAATVTARSADVVYSGRAQAVTGFSATGLVAGETEAVLDGVTTSGGSGTNAGSYAHTASGSDANYTLTFVDGALNIAKAPLTVTGRSLDTVYSGQTQSVAGFSVSGLVGDDTAQVLSGVSAAGASGRNAGTYANVVTAPAQTNYSVTTVDGMLDIARRPLSTWTGGSGLWSDAANWDVRPDADNVLAVSIPGTGGGGSPRVVTFDGAASSATLDALSLAAGSALAIEQPGLTVRSLRNDGELRLASSQALDLGGKTVDGVGTLRNEGRLLLAGTATDNALVNTGTVQARGQNRTGPVDNSGRFEVLDGTTTLGQGTYTQSAGTLVLGSAAAGSGTLALPAGAVALLQGGALVGTGVLAGSLAVDAARVAPGFSPGSIGVTGNLSMSPASTLALEIAAPSAGGFDTLAVAGTASLGGTLEVSTLGGFQPATSERYAMISSGSVTGSFGQVVLDGQEVTSSQAAMFPISAGGSLQALPMANLAPPDQTVSPALNELSNTTALPQVESVDLTPPAYTDPVAPARPAPAAASDVSPATATPTPASSGSTTADTPADSPVSTPSTTSEPSSSDGNPPPAADATSPAADDN
ncbi:MBG domain-containing protein, partial [Mycolicibacterium sp.]|uniref:MBG domain-containing protein n=1 Tax=Mycolicibacterium sp. TaxID=2320850 RepID=UPI0028AEE69F